jgi:hypothetical protein
LRNHRATRTVYMTMKTLATGLLCALLAGCATPLPSSAPLASPRPTATASPGATTSPSPIADAPYRISVLGSGGSPGPTILISTAADCDPLPSDWLRQVCGLTLRSAWQAIIAETDPLGDPTSGTSSPTWWAALERASIDGDTSLCSDVSMRTWVSLGSSLGAAPEPGSTPSPVHPVAACVGFLRSTAASGSFQINDQGAGNPQSIVKLYVDPGAVAKAAAGSAPAFDPIVACDLRSLTRDLCNQLVAVVITALGSRQSQVQTLLVRGVPAECLTSASPCPSPAGGFMGSVSAGPINKTEFAFDVTNVGGQLKVTEIPYKP